MAKEFPQKYLKKLNELPDFFGGIESTSTDEIKTKIVNFENHIYEIENAKDDDEELAKLKEQVKNITAPYRESKNLETAKIKYCLYVLEERGVKV